VFFFLLVPFIYNPFDINKSNTNGGTFFVFLKILILKILLGVFGDPFCKKLFFNDQQRHQEVLRGESK
jgi:hypothetical protein